MTTGTHKLIIGGVILLASIALIGVLVLAWYGKTVDAAVAGIAGVAVGGMLGHLNSPDKKIEDPNKDK